MLLLHGLSSSPLELRYLARYLQDEGFTICAPVIEGYSAGSAELPMERWIEGAVREYDALARATNASRWVGLSIGGALALRLIQERPDAQALALLSLTLTYNGWAIPWYRFILDLAYYTPLRHRYRYREAEPFGLRNEGAARQDRARHGARRVQRGRPVRDLAAGAAPGENRLARLARRQLGEIENDTLVIHSIDDETSSPRNPNPSSSGSARASCAPSGSTIRTT
ncbi:alpha/beta hydrolase [Burkholderia gladioli]|uniref:alpha/beta hydrolase n=1 Tax=Burkholderia gladioli TaxID=28095 RepID=UPI003D1EF4DD